MYEAPAALGIRLDDVEGGNNSQLVLLDVDPQKFENVTGGAGANVPYGT